MPTTSLARPRTAARSVWLGYAAVASLAAGADLASKQLATLFLGDDAVVPLLGRLSLMLVYNTGSAGGVMIGPYTWQINVLVTMAAIVLITTVVAPLRAVSRLSTVALGLVAGGAFGNLASMLVGPAGVADFIAVQLAGDMAIVLNVADLALWAGALLLVPVALSLVRAIRRDGARPTAR